MAKEPFSIESVLNDVEISSLNRLAEDQTMINALKKIFLFGVYYNGTLKEGTDPNPLMNFAMRIDENNIMTDEQLGRVLRAKTEGVITVELGFRELEKFKIVAKPEQPAQNRGR
jgi:hypothetical protein